ncbi:hypothetical protein [Rhodococcus sp. PD04]|nr:hypothetical protein [Rhodococcus sp. PD04]WSE22341.1 hypothetical protein U9J23_22250 [Rhodococcus sp. PD04]
MNVANLALALVGAIGWTRIIAGPVERAVDALLDRLEERRDQ